MIKFLTLLLIAIGFAAAAQAGAPSDKARALEMAMEAFKKFQRASLAEKNYILANAQAREALRAYFEVESETYFVFGENLQRTAAAGQAQNALAALDSARLDFILDGGTEQVITGELFHQFIEESQAEILTYFEEGQGSGVDEALRYGRLADFLSRARLNAARAMATRFDGWPQDAQDKYELAREKFLADYGHLLNLVRSDSRAPTLFERKTGEKFQSLILSKDSGLFAAPQSGRSCGALFIR